MIYSHRYNALRKVLQATRKKAHLTQVELAVRLERGQSYVSKIERGEQFVDVLEFVLWCEACEVAPSSIIDLI